VTRQELKSIVAEVIEADLGELDPETDLRSLPGYDSVNVLVLMIALDERAGIRLGPDKAATLRFYREIEELAVAQGVKLDS
jgi:acyl carrier protein